MTSKTKLHEVASDIRAATGSLPDRIIDNTLHRGKELGLRLSHINATDSDYNTFAYVRSDWAKLEVNLDGVSYTLTKIDDDNRTYLGSGQLHTHGDYVEMLRTITDWAKTEVPLTAKTFADAVADENAQAALRELAGEIEDTVGAYVANAIFRDVIQNLPNR